MSVWLSILLAISSEISEIKDHIYIQDMQSLGGFSVIPKCMTLNDPDSYLTLNSGLCVCVRLSCQLLISIHEQRTRIHTH